MNSITRERCQKFRGLHLDIRPTKGKEHIICCPKKRIPHAVRRNRLKRIMRELLRASLHSSALYIRVLSDPLEQDGIRLRDDWQLFLSRISRDDHE